MVADCMVAEPRLGNRGIAAPAACHAVVGHPQLSSHYYEVALYLDYPVSRRFVMWLPVFGGCRSLDLRAMIAVTEL